MKYRIEYTLGEGDFESKFIRTCPVGIKSCFGAKGFYDRDDKDLLNDICKYLKVIILYRQFRITKLFSNDFLYLFIFEYFLAVEFFGCSEAKHKQDYGCDEDDQKMDVPDKYKKLVQVHKSHI